MRHRGRKQHVRPVSVPAGSNSPADCWKVRGSLRSPDGGMGAVRHPLRGGIMHRAGARIRLAGKSLKTLRRSIFFTRPLMAHQRNALLESRAFFLCPAFEKAASGAPSGTKTARPAGQRPGRFQQSCGLLESARVPAEPGWRNGGSAPSPSGRDHASRERSHSPRGEVAKYAPQERFLHAPAGAPKKALRKRKAFPFLWLVWLYTA